MKKLISTPLLRNKKVIIRRALIVIFLLLINVEIFHYSFADKERSEIINNKNNVSLRDLACRDCNLIIVSLSNVIANRLGSYGYHRDTSPNIDKFNSKAFLFKNAFTVSSWTSPAAASLLTSLYPYAHNLMRWHRDVKPLSPDIPTLAGILKNNGYRAASFNGGADYDRVYGLDKGFETYFQGEPFTGLKDLIPPTVKWLEENKNKKFFFTSAEF